MNIVPAVGGIPEMFEMKRQEHTIKTALPFALTVTLNGITNRAILLSSLSDTSQARSISGIATALKYRTGSTIKTHLMHITRYSTECKE